MRIVYGILMEISRILNGFLRIEKIIVMERIIANIDFEREAKIPVVIKLISRDQLSSVAREALDPKAALLNVDKDAHLFAIGSVDGYPAHRTFVAFKKAYVGAIEQEIRLDYDSAYLFRVYTDPHYRGLGIATKAISKILSHLCERGIKRVYALIRNDNFPSLRLFRKIGFRKIGAIKFIKIFLFKYYRIKAETKKDHITLRKLFLPEKKPFRGRIAYFVFV